jgi:hypothetical protein
VVLLRVVAGLAVTQVAGIAGKRPGAVRVRLHRACAAWPTNPMAVKRKKLWQILALPLPDFLRVTR